MHGTILGFINLKHPDFVCKLKKALYGVKQATLAWNEKFKKMLPQQGFRESKVYYIPEAKNGRLTFSLAYVDDDLIVVTQEEQGSTKKLYATLTKRLKIKKRIWGCNIPLGHSN